MSSYPFFESEDSECPDSKYPEYGCHSTCFYDEGLSCDWCFETPEAAHIPTSEGRPTVTIPSDNPKPDAEARTCYCGTTAAVVPGTFPHRDCDGSVPAGMTGDPTFLNIAAHDHSWAQDMDEVYAACPAYNPLLAADGDRCPGDPAGNAPRERAAAPNPLHVHILVRDDDGDYDCKDPACTSGYYDPMGDAPAPAPFIFDREAQEQVRARQAWDAGIAAIRTENKEN